MLRGVLRGRRFLWSERASDGSSRRRRAPNGDFSARRLSQRLRRLRRAASLRARRRASERAAASERGCSLRSRRSRSPGCVAFHTLRGAAPCRHRALPASEPPVHALERVRTRARRPLSPLAAAAAAPASRRRIHQSAQVVHPQPGRHGAAALAPRISSPPANPIHTRRPGVATARSGAHGHPGPRRHHRRSPLRPRPPPPWRVRVGRATGSAVRNAAGQTPMHDEKAPAHHLALSALQTLSSAGVSLWIILMWALSRTSLKTLNTSLRRSWELVRCADGYGNSTRRSRCPKPEPRVERAPLERYQSASAPAAQTAGAHARSRRARGRQSARPPRRRARRARG